MNEQEVLDFVEQFREALMDLPGPKRPKAQNGREFILRCPYCGDSENKSHCHLGIKMFPPFLFRCPRCETRGVVNKEFLSDINFHSTYFSGTIFKINKKLSKEFSKNHKFDLKEDYKLKNINLSCDINTKLAKEKIKYFEERSGIILTEDLISKFKLILDFKEFFRNNKFIRKTTLTVQNLIDLHENYIGFLSNDGNFITFRRINNKENLYRYFDYNIYNLQSNTRRFFTIKNTIDLLIEKPTINITEGIFDILGIYNLKNMNDKEIYCAMNSKAINNIIKYFIKLGYLNFNLNIYADKDVSFSKFKHMLQSNKFLSIIKPSVNIYHNSKDHDYGIKKENIDLKLIGKL